MAWYCRSGIISQVLSNSMMIWYGRGKLSNASSVKAEAVRRRKDKVQTKTEISFPANIEGRERSGAGQFVSTYEIGFGIRLLSSSLANVVELVESLVDVVSVIEEGNGWTRSVRSFVSFRAVANRTAQG